MYMPAQMMGPPILPMTVGLVDSPAVDSDAMSRSMEDSTRKWSMGLPPKGSGTPTWLGYLTGAVGGGVGAYYLLPKAMGEYVRAGVAAAGGLLLLGPIGGYLGAMVE